MSNKHTQGPWSYTEYEAGSDVIGLIKWEKTGQPGRGPDGKKRHGIIASIQPASDGWNYEDNVRENGILIAAAPEMLEMLYAILPAVEESDEFNKPNLKQAVLVRMLIAKAEGRV